MINGSFSEFKNILCYGGELLFEYKGSDYFIQGWSSEGLCTMVLDNLTHPSTNGYVWECSCNKMRECAEKFLKDPIWDGKSFSEIQKDTIWKEF